MSEFQLRTPVVFIIFNRPDTTERVFAEIAKARPPRLLVVADGPRAGREGESEKVVATRAIIDRVDWDCKVLTNFSEINLGCKARVSSGLDWAFKQVEEAIILEDDCLPHPTFFRYCEELLGYYRYDQRVGMISGDNFQFGYRMNDDSYYFSNIIHIWGWACWRDRWQQDYDVAMQYWPKVRDEGRIADWTSIRAEQNYLTDIFEKVFNGFIDTWDYQWYFGSRLNGRISVIPNVNLISNIGFGVDATHTKIHSKLSNMKTEEIYFPMKHPLTIFASQTLDRLFNKAFVLPKLSQRLKNKVKTIINSK